MVERVVVQITSDSTGKRTLQFNIDKRPFQYAKAWTLNIKIVGTPYMHM